MGQICQIALLVSQSNNMLIYLLDAAAKIEPATRTLLLEYTGLFKYASVLTVSIKRRCGYATEKAF